MAADITWCKKQGKGIKLIDPNDNLSIEYMNSCEETLTFLKDLQGKSNMWLATTKYYAEYFAVYSLLMKIGIKCEIHDCTITLCKLLEEEQILPIGTKNILEKDKELRIDNQYYLKNKIVDLNYEKVLLFCLEIKKITNSLTEKQILDIRRKIEKN